MNFDKAFNLVVGVEGGYSLNPNDPGGETKYGISKRSYPSVDIAALTLDAAKAIYQSDYWNAVSGDSLPWPLALLVFDCAVNQGQPVARVLLQTALGVAADGDIGPKTLAAAAASTVWHAAKFMDLRVKRYLANPNAPTFGDGWIIRCFTVCLKQGG